MLKAIGKKIFTIFCWKLLFISWFICSRRWCMDKLGVFHANQTSVSWFISELMVRLVLRNTIWFKPSSKILLFLTDRSKAVLLMWIICGIFVLCLSCFCVCSLLPCGHLLAKGWPLGSCLWCLIVLLSLSHVVSWVRCGTWLYNFLIFAPFVTCLYLNLWWLKNCWLGIKASIKLIMSYINK